MNILAAFGNKETTLKRLRAGNTNKLRLSCYFRLACGFDLARFLRYGLLGLLNLGFDVLNGGRSGARLRGSKRGNHAKQK